MIEFQINGKEYRAQKLNAFEQFHVSRKVAPIIPTLVPVFVKLARDKQSILADLSGFADLMQPFAEGIASMSNADSEYVIATCLSVVQRRSGDTWASVWSKQNNCQMFDDIDLSAMIPMILKVIQDSLGPFIQGLLMSQTTGEALA